MHDHNSANSADRLRSFLTILTGDRLHAFRIQEAVKSEQEWDYVPEEARRVLSFKRAWEIACIENAPQVIKTEHLLLSRKQRQIANTLSDLPVADSITLYLCDIEGWRQVDVSQIMGVSPSTVSARLRRTRLALDNGRSVEENFGQPDLETELSALFSEIAKGSDLPERSMAVSDAKTVEEKTGRGNKRLHDSKWKGFFTYLTMMVLCGFLAYFISNQGPPVSGSQSADLFRLASEAEVELTFASGRPEVIQEKALEVFDTRFDMAGVEGMNFSGLGSAKIGANLEIPVILFGDAGTEECKIFVFSYSMLDNAHPFDFSDHIYDALVVEGTYFTDSGDEMNAVVWRWRDDIYVVFGTDSPREFSGRLYRL